MSILEAPIVLKLAPELAGILLSPEEFDAVGACEQIWHHSPLPALHLRQSRLCLGQPERHRHSAV